MTAFLAGLIAGYGIAIPVGAIALLIINTSIQYGLGRGVMAAAGAASADFLYAGLAVIAGNLIAALLTPYSHPLRYLSSFVLVIIGGVGLCRLRFPTAGVKGSNRQPRGFFVTYVQFLGLTLLNPLTVAYFAALILGQTAGAVGDNLSRIAFVAGAGIASLSWQLFLALLGSIGHRHFSPGLQRLTGLVGNLIVIGFGVRILVQFIQ